MQEIVYYLLFSSCKNHFLVQIYVDLFIPKWKSGQFFHTCVVKMPGNSVWKLIDKDILLGFKITFYTISNTVAYSDILGDLGLTPSGVPPKTS